MVLRTTVPAPNHAKGSGGINSTSPPIDRSIQDKNLKAKCCNEGALIFHSLTKAFCRAILEAESCDIVVSKHKSLEVLLDDMIELAESAPEDMV
ncbi:hypothetical protein EJB05_22843 [Eragrostis curvula]|uniref:Uncharacterized protein n=1 Tax=Eragrostis curvula TaxID=38414 RepID=A0A5J9V6N2_9POAL|nr:hypothetical protein EJB05_22843 [Eragrostis curvula]